jgi:hypothetical protein
MRLMTSPLHSLQGREVEDRLDREIASLRQLVENETHGEDVNEEAAHAKSASWAFRIFAAKRKPSPDQIPDRTLLPPTRFVVVLRRARRFVRVHGSAVAFYGFCVGLTLAGVWLVLSMTGP